MFGWLFRIGGYVEFSSSFSGIANIDDRTLFQVYMAGAIYFAANTALASISAFLPTIIQTFGSSTLQLTSLPLQFSSFVNL